MPISRRSSSWEDGDMNTDTKVDEHHIDAKFSVLGSYWALRLYLPHFSIDESTENECPASWQLLRPQSLTFPILKWVFLPIPALQFLLRVNPHFWTPALRCLGTISIEPNRELVRSSSVTKDPANTTWWNVSILRPVLIGEALWVEDIFWIFAISLIPCESWESDVRIVASKRWSLEIWFHNWRSVLTLRILHILWPHGRDVWTLLFVSQRTGEKLWRDINEEVWNPKYQANGLNMTSLLQIFSAAWLNIIVYSCRDNHIGILVTLRWVNRVQRV